MVMVAVVVVDEGGTRCSGDCGSVCGDNRKSNGTNVVVELMVLIVMVAILVEVATMLMAV